jgi:nucleoside-diphosphate-sugar epimerase
VLASRPDAIVHQATALAHARFGRRLDRTFATTNQLRTAGTDALLAAARDAGVRRFVAQSFAPYLGRAASVNAPLMADSMAGVATLSLMG